MAADRRAFEHAVHEIRMTFGVDLSLDAEGAATIQFNDDVTCTLEVPADSDFAFFHAVVDKIPEKNNAQIMRMLLQTNAFDLPLATGWIALDADTDEIILCASLPLESISTPMLIDTLNGCALLIPEFRQAIGHAVETVMPEADKRETSDGANSTISYEMQIRI